ncbi:MAG: hypothetical protein ACRD4I_12305 [Candidatus Angelobacter sp.]
MTIKTWLKGLAVFVFSSVITGLAATNLDPANFNFSRAGLLKLGSLVAIIGAKAVLLYMKQSPLNAGAVKLDWTRISGLFLLGAALLLAGCYTSWERDTYATLAVNRQVIDCAVAGYNHFDADIRHACTATPDDPAFDPATFYLPQTRAAQQTIEKARQAQVAAVEAFETYAVAKLAKDPATPLMEKEAAVVTYLQQLPALMEAVRELRGN